MVVRLVSDSTGEAGNGAGHGADGAPMAAERDTSTPCASSVSDGASAIPPARSIGDHIVRLAMAAAVPQSRWSHPDDTGAPQAGDDVDGHGDSLEDTDAASGPLSGQDGHAMGDPSPPSPPAETGGAPFSPKYLPPDSDADPVPIEPSEPVLPSSTAARALGIKRPKRPARGRDPDRFDPGTVSTRNPWQMTALRAAGELQCSLGEVAALLGVTPAVLRKWFEREPYALLSYQAAMEAGKTSLRRHQFKLAETNASMAMFLGKNYLGQSDRTEITGADGGAIQTDNLIRIEFVSSDTSDSMKTIEHGDG